MIALLRNGDYCPDGMGGFRQAWGGEEVLERVLFQLTARRGSFPLLPQVGSRLYLLGREKPGIGDVWLAERIRWMLSAGELRMVREDRERFYRSVVERT